MKALYVDFECVSSPACMCVWRADAVMSVRRLASGGKPFDEGRVCICNQSLSYSMKEQVKLAGGALGSMEHK